MSNIAEAYIAAFQRGEDFQRPAAGLMDRGQPDAAALELFGRALAVADAPVREKLVALLVDLAHQSDPLTPLGAEVIRHRYILELLAGPGLAKADLGREAALSALRKLALQPDLTRFEDAFVALLQAKPTGEAFLLLAKAKPAKAREPLAELVAKRGATSEYAKIARAALGEQALEAEFLQAVQEADASGDAQALAAAIRNIGLIGTPRCLRVVGEHLRTPAIISIPSATEKTVRLDVLEALLYNFPDQPAFYPNNINDDNGYAMAEQLCINALGVVYQYPRPRYMKYKISPRGGG